jgi:hypothetical protein
MCHALSSSLRTQSNGSRGSSLQNDSDRDDGKESDEEEEDDNDEEGGNNNNQSNNNNEEEQEGIEPEAEYGEAELELSDATVKLLRLLANLSIESDIGHALAKKTETLQVGYPQLYYTVIGDCLN